MTFPPGGGWQQPPPQQQGWQQPQQAPQQQGWQQPQQPPYGGGYGANPPQQQWGQQAPQQPQADVGDVEDFFAQSGGGGAPSFAFGDVGTGVVGTIVAQRPRQRTNMQNQPLYFTKGPNAGKPQVQLEVTLQTDLRGWQGVKKIPTTNVNGQDVPMGPEMDDGKRRVFLWYTSRDAVADAVQRAGKQFTEVGGKLGLKVERLEQNPQGGNPIKHYVAMYEPPTQDTSGGFFEQAAPQPQVQQPVPGVPPAGQAAAQWPQQPAPQQPAPQQPWQGQQQVEAQVNPWAQGQSDSPPF